MDCRWNIRWSGWQVRPIPVAHMAPRRDGRPHSSQRSDSRRDYGSRRRVPGGTILPGVRGVGNHDERDNSDRRIHRPVRRNDGSCRHRHKASAGVLHGQPAWLHDAGSGRRGILGGDIPPVPPRLLQSLIVPGFRQRQPRIRDFRHALHGRTPKSHAHHIRILRHWRH